jgi:lipopolysaccharide transport system ATP-binding protein
MSFAMSVQNVSKRFLLQRNRSWTLRETVRQWFNPPKDGASFTWALRDVSFTVEHGQVFGIIGHNGAGKSTLLRLLCGLGRPTAGHITHTGTVSGILELGGGFHPDLTGRQNIATIAILNGVSKAELKAREQSTIAFAEMEDFIDQPVRTYSNGMYLRLAFAAATEFDPEILVLDEVLSVGDEEFQKKCLDRITNFCKAGKTLIVTSHDSHQIESLCDQVLVLDGGRVLMQGDPKSALTCYHDVMRQRTDKRIEEVTGGKGLASLATTRGSRHGTQEAAITAVKIYDCHGNSATSIQSGEGLILEIQTCIPDTLSDVACSIGIFNDAKLKCYERPMNSIREVFGALSQHQIIRCEIRSLPLRPGYYFVNVGLFPNDWSYMYDYHWQMHSFQVEDHGFGNEDTTGVMALETRWAVRKLSPNREKEDTIINP